MFKDELILWLSSRTLWMAMDVAFAMISPNSCKVKSVVVSDRLTVTTEWKLAIIGDCLDSQLAGGSEGVKEGISVGVSVGTSAGGLEGAKEGETEGMFLGRLVGELLGKVIGKEDGLFVGDKVQK